MRDKITGVGEYKVRDGRKATVVDIKGRTAIGWLHFSDKDEPACASWYHDSGRCHGAESSDIVGQWVEPQRKPREIWMRTVVEDEPLNPAAGVAYSDTEAQLMFSGSGGTIIHFMEVIPCTSARNAAIQ